MKFIFLSLFFFINSANATLTSMQRSKIQTQVKQKTKSDFPNEIPPDHLERIKKAFLIALSPQQRSKITEEEVVLEIRESYTAVLMNLKSQETTSPSIESPCRISTLDQVEKFSIPNMELTNGALANAFYQAFGKKVNEVSYSPKVNSDRTNLIKGLIENAWEDVRDNFSASEILPSAGNLGKNNYGIFKVTVKQGPKSGNYILKITGDFPGGSSCPESQRLHQLNGTLFLKHECLHSISPEIKAAMGGEENFSKLIKTLPKFSPVVFSGRIKNLCIDFLESAQGEAISDQHNDPGKSLDFLINLQEKVGGAMAAFHLLGSIPNYRKGSPNLISWTHGDINTTNAFFDAKSNSLTLIDNSGFTGKQDFSNLILNLETIGLPFGQASSIMAQNKDYLFLILIKGYLKMFENTVYKDKVANNIQKRFCNTIKENDEKLNALLKECLEGKF